MPSPEYYYQQRAEVPTPSPHLQAVVTDLAAYHEVDLSQAGVHFTFARPEQDTHWLISNHEGKIDVAHCPTTDDFMVPDLDVLLGVTPEGWQTEKVVYSATAWQVYAETTAEPGQPPADPSVAFPFFAFTEYVAQLLKAEALGEQASAAADVKTWLSLE